VTGDSSTHAPDGGQQRRLIAAAIRGERDAMRAVWEENRRWVAAVIIANKPAWADVEDIMQDVAATLVKKVGTLRDEAMFKPWLRTVAANAARVASRDLSQRRRSIPFPGGSDQGDPMEQRAGAAPDAIEELAAKDQRAHGQKLLELASQLPDGYREPLIMRCIQDMSYRQIGEVLGLPETTIETRIARGRRMLRDLATGQGAVPAGREPAPGRAKPQVLSVL
jgi:RNA polymerase sigma-70 factor (ECF subfamily)